MADEAPAEVEGEDLVLPDLKTIADGLALAAEGIAADNLARQAVKDKMLPLINSEAFEEVLQTALELRAQVTGSGPHLAHLNAIIMGMSNLKSDSL